MVTLVIDGTGRSEDSSKTKYLANKYLATQNYDNIELVDLYKISPPFVDSEIIKYWETDADTLANNLLKQFISADRYIFIYPTWNWSVPAIVRAYLDLIIISGKTFGYNSIGLKKGLLKNKSAILISTTGGREYPKLLGSLIGAQSGDNYVCQILKTLGIKKIKRISIDRTAYRFQDSNDNFDYKKYHRYVDKLILKHK